MLNRMFKTKSKGFNKGGSEEVLSGVKIIANDLQLLAIIANHCQISRNDCQLLAMIANHWQ